jgi:hypothetical protein
MEAGHVADAVDAHEAWLGVVDEEDAVDVMDPRRTSIRIYWIRNVGFVTRKPPSTASVRQRAQSAEQSNRSFASICSYITAQKSLRANNSMSQKIFSEINFT